MGKRKQKENTNAKRKAFLEGEEVSVKVTPMGNPEEEVMANAMKQLTAQVELPTTTEEEVSTMEQSNTPLVDALEEQLEEAIALNNENEGEEHTMQTNVAPSILDLLEHKQQPKVKAPTPLKLTKKMKDVVVKNADFVVVATFLSMSLMEQQGYGSLNKDEMDARGEQLQDALEEAGMTEDRAMDLIMNLILQDGHLYIDTMNKLKSNAIGPVFAWALTGDVILTKSVNAVFKEMRKSLKTIVSINASILDEFSNQEDIYGLRDLLVASFRATKDVNFVQETINDYRKARALRENEKYVTIDVDAVVDVQEPAKQSQTEARSVKTPVSEPVETVETTEVLRITPQQAEVIPFTTQPKKEFNTLRQLRHRVWA